MKKKDRKKQEINKKGRKEERKKEMQKLHSLRMSVLSTLGPVLKNFYRCNLLS